jgi:hypothetical protein
MKQQANNSQSTTAQALTSFPANPQLYIFAYTITDNVKITQFSLYLARLTLSVSIWL